jgi:cellulose synthase/poly-beta-1,6-N-acetylglucosamine synthase-like glycosyltransferase
MDSTFAILDAANEIIANHIYRKGANALGLSSSVIGSGMAFHYPLIKGIMQEVNAVGGFDKVLQLEVINRGYAIYFLEHARIFDEKVPGAEAFKHQRRRWLSSQWVYLKQFFIPGIKAFFRGELNYFNLSVCQNMLLPRMLLLAATGGLAVLYLVIGRYLFIPVYAWWLLLLMYGISLAIGLPAMFYSKYIFRAIAGLPKALGIMVGLVFRLKGANNTFIHTKHSKTQIDNPLLDAVEK